MTVTQIVGLLKLKLGIATTVQDERLTHLVEDIMDEMEIEKGIVLNLDNQRHTSFITDYAEYRYRNVGEDFPRYLMHRYYSLFLKDTP